MSTRIRRAVAAGLLLGAMALASVAMGSGVAAQQAGVIQTTGLPKVSASNLATSATALSVPQAVPAFPGYPFGYANYFGYGYYPYNGFGYGFGYPYTGASYSVPYYGYNYGYNYSYPYYGYGFGNVGCAPTVSYTPAFGVGYGCQRVYP